MTLYEAGGYENLPKQLSQFDDCMASNPDAIIVGAISGAGLGKKFEEARPRACRSSASPTHCRQTPCPLPSTSILSPWAR
jgi:hypothetical protein